MTSKQLKRLYEKVKAEYLTENDCYLCKGCGYSFYSTAIHHIIKRSQSKYYYADKRNFILLCQECHEKAEGTIFMQSTLDCFNEMENTRVILMDEYNSLKLYEQSLSFKYG